MSAADRPEQPIHEEANATSHKLYADSSATIATEPQGSHPMPSDLDHPLPSLSIVDAGAKQSSKMNGNLTTENRQTSPNSNKSKEADSKGDQITVTRTISPSSDPRYKEDDSVSTAHPDGSSTTVTQLTEKNGNVDKYVDLNNADGTHRSVDIDPKTGKPDMVSGDGVVVEIDPHTGKTTDVLLPTQTLNGVDVRFDTRTGKPNEVIDENFYGPSTAFKIDPVTGKASADPLRDLLLKYGLVS